MRAHAHRHAHWSRLNISNMRRAIEVVGDLGLTSLEEHLSQLDERMKEHSQALRTHYRDLAERATVLLVRTP